MTEQITNKSLSRISDRLRDVLIEKNMPYSALRIPGSTSVSGISVNSDMSNFIRICRILKATPAEVDYILDANYTPVISDDLIPLYDQIQSTFDEEEKWLVSDLLRTVTRRLKKSDISE